MEVSAFAVNVGLQPLTEGVDNTDANSMQPSCDFVRFVIKFSTSVKSGKNNLQGTYVSLFMEFNRNAPAVILDGTGAIGVDVDDYIVTITCEGLIDGIIQDLIDQMVQPIKAAVANIHIRSFTYRVNTAEDFYFAGVVSMVLDANSSLVMVFLLAHITVIRGLIPG
jgi:hypothetical protein